MQASAEKVLVALYIEANSKKPQPASLHTRLTMEEEAFGRAVNLLYGAGMVGGVVVRFGDEDDLPVVVSTEDLLLKRRGVVYVEKALGLSAGTSLPDKLERIIGAAERNGWEDVAVMAREAYAELGKG